MSRNSKQGSIECQNHQFFLRLITSKKHFNKKIHASFCRIFKKNKKLAKSEIADSGCSLFPVFNNDKNYATPGFILPNQKKYFIENRKSYLKDHGRKIKQYQQITNELYLPEPRSSSDHCNVCCQPYQSYFQHINSQKHRDQIKRSRFNRYILQLEIKLNQFNPQAFSYKRSYEQLDIEISDTDEKNHNNKNQNQRSSNQIQRFVFQSSPRKKIKLQNQQKMTLNYQSGLLQVHNDQPSGTYLIQTGSQFNVNDYKENFQTTREFISPYFQSHQTFTTYPSNITQNQNNYNYYAQENNFLLQCPYQYQYNYPFLSFSQNSPYFSQQFMTLYGNLQNFTQRNDDENYQNPQQQQKLLQNQSNTWAHNAFPDYCYQNQYQQPLFYELPQQSISINSVNGQEEVFRQFCYPYFFVW